MQEKLETRNPIHLILYQSIVDKTFIIDAISINIKLRNPKQKIFMICVNILNEPI